MKASTLRHRITIQEATTAQDTYGQPSLTWSAVTTVWAAVEPLVGKENFVRDANQEIAETQHLFKIRYSSTTKTITQKMRVLYENEAFDILAVQNISGRKKMLYIYCKVVEGHEQ